jgi:hypothetical protein
MACIGTAAIILRVVFLKTALVISNGKRKICLKNSVGNKRAIYLLCDISYFEMSTGNGGG